MIYIPDFYHGDKIESWDDLQKATHFVIFKATQGITFVSPKLDDYIKNCEKHEIPYWLYSFLNRGHELAQAKFLVKTCKCKVGKMFRGYCLDVEMVNATNGVKDALDWLKTQTSKTMIYTFYADYDRLKKVIDNRGASCAWWEARTKINDVGEYDPDLPCHADADLHQYTWKGRCPGIKNKCDLSRLTGNMSEVFFVGTETKMPKTGTTAKDIIDIMEGWKGLSRKDQSHKVIIDLYNSHKPLARGYKVTYKDNYCATTISAAFIKANAVDLIGGTECSVERMIDDCFKPKGIWNEDGSVTPEEGWIITYNWDDKTQPNDGWADHIGVVVSVKNGEITVIEGNYGGEVKERKIKVGDGRIRGYAMPAYADASVKPSKPHTAAKSKYAGVYPTLPKRGFWRRGDGIETYKAKRDQIELVQKLVNWIAGTNLKIDGMYGEKTEKAVRKAQEILGVTVDGEFGKQTLEAAKKYER